MSRKLYYFIHDFDPHRDYSDGEVVSLYPDVSYMLDKEGITYSTLEAFYSEDKIFSDQDRHFREVLKWIEKLDKFFHGNISFCRQNNLALARINISILKYLVDELFIEAYTVNSFLKRLDEEKMEVRYVRYSSRKDKELCPRKFLREEKNNFLYDLLNAAASGKSSLEIKLYEFDRSADVDYRRRS